MIGEQLDNFSQRWFRQFRDRGECVWEFERTAGIGKIGEIGRVDVQPKVKIPDQSKENSTQ